MEIERLLQEAELLPHGEARMKCYKDAWEIADKEKDYDMQIHCRIKFIKESVFYSDVMQSFIAFPTMIKLMDDHYEEYGTTGETYSGLWYYKYILENAMEFYQISKKQFDAYFEDFKKRCIKYGFSLRTYYYLGFLFYSQIDMKKADNFYKNYILSKRDDLSDCKACELASEIEYYLKKDDFDTAKKMAGPLFNRSISCLEAPYGTYGDFIDYCSFKIIKGEEVKIDHIDFMTKELHRVITQKKLLVAKYSGKMLLRYALTDRSKALNWYKKYLITYENANNPGFKYDFSIGAMVFWAGIKDKKTYKIKLPNASSVYHENDTYVPMDMYHHYRSIAEKIANQFDQRNGTNLYSDKIQNILKYIKK